MATYTATIYDLNLTVVDTTTDVVDAGGSFRRNGVGDGFLVFPAQDLGMANAVTGKRERICHVTTTRGATTLVVALFLIMERRFFRDDQGREFVRISGPGMEQELGRHLITAEIHDGAHGPATDDVQQIIDYHPDWSLGTIITGTTDGTWHNFHEVTVLDALRAAGQQSGEIWRLSSLSTVQRKINWSPINTNPLSINLTLFDDVDLVNFSINEGVIRSFEQAFDQGEIVTRVYIYGSGTGDDRLTAAAATYTPPAGFSLNTSASLLVNDTLEAAGYYNERVIHFSDIRIPDTRFEIVEKNATSDFVTIQGDATTLFTASALFRVVESTDGNGVYTVSSSSYSAITNLTTINVTGDITGDTDDGYLEPAQFELIEVDAANDEFVIRGNWTSLFVAAFTFEVVDSGDDGTYTVSTGGSSYDSDGDNTTIPVDEDITNGTDSGFIVLNGSIGNAANIAAANALASAGYVWLKDRTDNALFYRLEAVYWLNAAPGDQVRIVYNRGTIAVDEIQAIDEVSYRIGSQGERVMRVVTAALGVHRSPASEETVARSLMSSLQDLLKNGTGGGQIAGTTLPTMAGHLAAQDPHPTYLLADGGRTLVGNLSVAAGRTIDGIDISAHAADPAAHHALVTAGNGIGVSGQVVSLDPPGTLTVSTTNSVSADSHTHAITSSSNPGAAARILASTSAGALTLQQMNVDNLRMDGNTFSATTGDMILSAAGGDVTLPSAINIGADNFISQLIGWRVTYAGAADFRTIYADELHVKAFIADIEQALAGGQIISKSVTTLSRDYTVLVGGRAIISASAALDYVALSGDLTSAIGAGQTFDIVGSTGNNGTYTVASSSPSGGNTLIFVNEDITSSVGDGTVRFKSNIYVDDLPGFEGAAVFSNDDWVRLRVIDRSGGGLIVADVWGLVAGYTDQGGGEQSWTIRVVDDGSVPGNVVNAGAIALDYGASGDGWHEITALDSDGPYAQIVTWVTDPSNSANYTLRSRLGNLDGVTDSDFPSIGGWGLYSTSAYLKGDLIAAGGTVTLDSDGITIESTGTAWATDEALTFVASSSGTVIGAIWGSHSAGTPQTLQISGATGSGGLITPYIQFDMTPAQDAMELRADGEIDLTADLIKITGTSNLEVTGGDTVLGGSTPAYRLDVRENVDGFVAQFFNDGNNSNRRGIIVQAGEDSNPTHVAVSIRDGDGNGIGFIGGNGSGGTTYSTTSDERTKQDIAPLGAALDNLLALEPVTYRGLGAPQSRAKRAGLIAQRVQAVLPGVVTQMDGDLLGLDYMGIVPYLIGAIQELNARIAQLEAA